MQCEGTRGSRRTVSPIPGVIGERSNAWSLRLPVQTEGENVKGNKCPKCGGIVVHPGTQYAATGKECTCGQEVNLAKKPFPR